MICRMKRGYAPQSSTIPTAKRRSRAAKPQRKRPDAKATSPQRESETPDQISIITPESSVFVPADDSRENNDVSAADLTSRNTTVIVNEGLVDPRKTAAYQTSEGSQDARAGFAEAGSRHSSHIRASQPTAEQEQTNNWEIFDILSATGPGSHFDFLSQDEALWQSLSLALDSPKDTSFSLVGDHTVQNACLMDPSDSSNNCQENKQYDSNQRAEDIPADVLPQLEGPDEPEVSSTHPGFQTTHMLNDTSWMPLDIEPAAPSVPDCEDEPSLFDGSFSTRDLVSQSVTGSPFDSYLCSHCKLGLHPTRK